MESCRRLAEFWTEHLPRGVNDSSWGGGGSSTTRYRRELFGPYRIRDIAKPYIVNLHIFETLSIRIIGFGDRMLKHCVHGGQEFRERFRGLYFHRVRVHGEKRVVSEGSRWSKWRVVDEVVCELCGVPRIFAQDRDNGIRSVLAMIRFRIPKSVENIPSFNLRLSVDKDGLPSPPSK